MTKHWSDSDFLNKLYEIGPDDNHLDECAECRARWNQWLALRRDLVTPPAVENAFLADQRRKLQHRIDRRSVWPAYMKWSPALAVAGLALFALTWRTPQPPVETRLSTDAQLMSEIYQTVSDAEPRAVEPLRGLFQGAE